MMPHPLLQNQPGRVGWSLIIGGAIVAGILLSARRTRAATQPVPIEPPITIPEPGFVDVGGIQYFARPVAETIAINLATMIWLLLDPQTSQGGALYTAFSPEAYRVRYGIEAPVAPGYPPNTDSPGTYIMVNVLSLETLTFRPFAELSVIVGDESAARFYAESGVRNFGVILVGGRLP